MQILEGQTLELRNVLSFRAKMTQQELAAKSQEIEKLLQENGAKRTANPVTATFAVEQGMRGQIVDIELLLPLDKEIAPPEGYLWKPRFLLTNAVVVRHVGNPATMHEALSSFKEYISKHHLKPVTPGYNVTVRDAKSPQELDEMIVNVYIGVQEKDM